jgi:hypothetical protein
MSCPRIGGFQDEARLSLLVSPVGALWASGARGFRRRGTTGGRCVFHGLYLILESLSSAEFGRRPKRSSGFRLAVNSPETSGPICSSWEFPLRKRPRKPRTTTVVQSGIPLLPPPRRSGRLLSAP